MQASDSQVQVSYIPSWQTLFSENPEASLFILKNSN